MQALFSELQMFISFTKGIQLRVKQSLARALLGAEAMR